tara:strand:- start:16570 stop:17166 length:597 start_codon:yes stop_codon:yes gene_type:complete
MNNGYQAYQIYQSLKLHFTSDYDAVKYNFKTAVKQHSFEKRRDRYFFEKLSRRFKRDELVNYFTANLLENQNGWIGDMSDEVYSAFCARYDKLTYMFDQDIKKLAESGYTFDEMCSTTEDYSVNPILEALRAREIHPETVVLLDILVNFLKRLRTAVSDPLGINKDAIDLLLKYKSIVLQRPLPMEKIKNKVFLSFTS